MVTTLAIPPSRFRKPLHKCRASHLVPNDPFLANLAISDIKQDESITKLVLYAETTLMKKEMRNPILELFAIPRPWSVAIRFGSPLDFLAKHEDRLKEAFALLEHVQYYEVFCDGGQMPPRLVSAIIRSLPVTETFQEYSFGDVGLLPDQLLRFQEHVGFESVKHATLIVPPRSDPFTPESLVYLQSLRIPTWGAPTRDARALIKIIATLPNLEELETVLPIIRENEIILLRGLSAWLERPDCPLVRFKLNHGRVDSSLRNTMLKGMGSNRRLKELAIAISGNASVVHDDTGLMDGIIGISSIQRLEYSCSGSTRIKVAQTCLDYLLLPIMEARHFTVRFDCKGSTPEFAVVANMIQQASRIHRTQELIHQYFSRRSKNDDDEIPLSLWLKVFERLNRADACAGADSLTLKTTRKVVISSNERGMRRLNLSSIYQTLQLLTDCICWGEGRESRATVAIGGVGQMPKSSSVGCPVLAVVVVNPCSRMSRSSQQAPKEDYSYCTVL